MKKKDKEELLVEFLDWLKKEGLDLCKWGESDYWGTSGYQKMNLDKNVWANLFLEQKEYEEDV